MEGLKVEDLQPDTYLLLGRHLYEVVGWDAKDHSLRVRNVRTLHDVYLGLEEAARAEIIISAREREDDVIPAAWA